MVRIFKRVVVLIIHSALHDQGDRYHCYCCERSYEDTRNDVGWVHESRHSLVCACIFQQGRREYATTDQHDRLERLLIN